MADAWRRDAEIILELAEYGHVERARTLRDVAAMSEGVITANIAACLRRAGVFSRSVTLEDVYGYLSGDGETSRERLKNLKWSIAELTAVCQSDLDPLGIEWLGRRLAARG